MATRGDGEGSVYQRTDGRWVAQTPKVDGKRRYLYGKTKRDAQKKLRDAMRALDEGKPITNANRTISQVLQAWLETRVNLAPGTAQMYSDCIHRVEREIGGVKLGDLTPDRIERTYARLRERYAPDTVRGCHVVLNQATKAAIRWGWLIRSPLENVTAPPPGRPVQSPLSLVELRKLLDVVQIDRHYALILLMATSGLRSGEARALSWRHVDLDKGRITVERTLRSKSGPAKFGPPKTARSSRTITVTPQTVAALRAWRAKQNTERLAAGPGWNSEDLVFCASTGNPVSQSTFRLALERSLKRAGLQHVRIQDLRHTAATLRMTDTHPKVVQEILGHTSISTTLNRYSHTMESMHRESDQALDASLADPELPSEAV